MIFEYKDLTEENGTLLNPDSIIVVEEGLELGNPKMEIMSVFYNLKTNEFSIEVHFWENKSRHSRNFSTVNAAPGSLTMDAVMTFVATHPVLSQFAPTV
tara:strand:- start:1292 stop:1588 length:297 start_codon:yes stop_codon:yes gene_type:complete